MSDGSGPLLHAQTLALIRRTTDPGWYTGMQASPDGEAILNAIAATAETCSRAVMAQVDACAIATAPTGRSGECELYLARPTTLATATIPRGFLFVDSRGVQMKVREDIALVAGQTAIYVPLVTVRQIDILNNTEPAFDDSLEVGDVADVIVDPVNDIIYDSLGVALLPGAATYVSSTAIESAEADWLSCHGEERGCKRQPNEDGEAYRLRVRAVPTAVTPSAIQGAVHGAQAQADLPTIYMVEPMRDQASDTARATLDLIFADSMFFDEGFWDDPLGVDLPGKLPWRTSEMPSNREARAYFRLGIAGDLLEPDGSVWYLDDGHFDDPMWGFLDVGMHPSLIASLRSIDESARIRIAGGVHFDSYLECVQRVEGNGEVEAGAVYSQVFVVSAPYGCAWLLRDALITVTVAGAPVDPATDAYVVLVGLQSGVVLWSEWSTSCAGMPLRTFELERLGYFSQLVSHVVVAAKSSVAATIRADGTFWVSPVTL